MIDDRSFTAISVNGLANLTIIRSFISAGNYGIRVSTTEHEFNEEIWIPGDSEMSQSVQVTVKDTEIRGGSFGIQCYGATTDCLILNSLVQAISCQNVRSCTVQNCTMSSTFSYQLAVSATNAQTLVIDNSIVANESFGRAVYASRCNYVQARTFFACFNIMDTIA